MYNGAAFRQQQGIDDAMRKGVKDDNLAGDKAYEGGWNIGVSRLPVVELAEMLDTFGIEQLSAAWSIAIDGD